MKISITLINMFSKKSIIPALLLFILTGCSGFPGTFAYRTVEMDHFERLTDGDEFEQEQNIHWVFVPDTPKDISAGVVVLQKKAVWIDVASRVVPVTLVNPNIYGTLLTEEAGEYELQIIVDHQVVDSVRYRVYGSEDSDPFKE